MGLKIEKFGLYLANLDPVKGTEPGKTRPVVVIQSDLLNETHPSTLICPLTTNIVKEAEILRVHVTPTAHNGLSQPSDIIVDQVRAIDNKRFLKRLGRISAAQERKLLESLHILVCE